MIPTLQHPPDELLGDPVYPRLKEYLIESTGLAYYADKDADLARRIRRRLSGFGFQDCATYLDLLRDPARGASEMDALIEQVTIGETYFFRHREHFDALRDQVLPDLIARNAGRPQLRIWCAGCADGAEPYSLSILLRRELAHVLRGWEVSILATDINRQCLATAREGRYEQWSLRSTPEHVKQACFEERAKTWTLAPEYKTGISFQFHNLVEDAFPPQLNGSSVFDLIICRNVMIYFGPKLMRRIVKRFHDCLVPSGWLLVGPSEPNMTHFTSFRAVNAPGVTLYQRPNPSLRDSPDDISFPTPLPPADVIPESALPEVPVPSAEQIATRRVPTLADLRQSADRGDWENAADCGKELIESDNLNAAVHFHYALVLGQLGNHAESERSLRRAIYLDRQAVPAHYHLGLLLRSHGDLRQAERCFSNVLDLLMPLAGGEIMAGADGITVAELRKLAQKQIETLQIEGLKESMKTAAIQWDEVRKRVQANEESLRRTLSESPERIKIVFRQRAAKLANEPAETHAEKKPVARAIPALVVRVAGERYAIALKELAEVLPFRGCTPIPGALRQFLGVLNLRGDLRPVIDLAWVLSGSPSSDSGTILVLRRPAALKVDAVEDLREIASEALTPPVPGNYVQALASGTLGLLDVDTMLSAVFSPKESRSR